LHVAVAGEMCRLLDLCTPLATACDRTIRAACCCCCCCCWGPHQNLPLGHGPQPPEPSSARPAAQSHLAQNQQSREEKGLLQRWRATPAWLCYLKNDQAAATACITCLPLPADCSTAILCRNALPSAIRRSPHVEALNYLPQCTAMCSRSMENALLLPAPLLATHPTRHLLADT
jgi:hypothetical protein